MCAKNFTLKMGKNATETFNIMNQQTIKKTQVLSSFQSAKAM